MDEKDRYIRLLNLAFEKEYNDVFSYLREADLFIKKIVSGERLGAIFNEFSMEELRHADRLAVEMIELKAAPKWVFRPLETTGSLREMLGRHVDNEMSAIRVYDELLGLCRDRDFKLVLKGIRENEEEHLEKVSHILKRLKE